MGAEHQAEHDSASPSAAKTTLHIEMHSSERQVLTTFREQFMRWVNDYGASTFARDTGAPQKISFEEGASNDAGLAAVLNLDLVWSSRRSATKTDELPQTSSTTALSVPSSHLIEPLQRFVFFPDPSSEVPRHPATSLFDGRTLYDAPSRVEWARMERPALLEMMHKGVALSVRAYDATKAQLALVIDDPSRLVPTIDGRTTVTPRAVRIRMSNSALRESHSWFSVVRRAGVLTAVGFATLLLVFAAYKSRTSDVLAADQTARAESLRQHAVSPAAEAQPSATPAAAPAAAASSPRGVAAPVAQAIKTLNLSPSTAPAAPLETKVATMGNAAPRVIDAPRRADRAVAPTTRSATPITPVAMLGRSEIVGGLQVVSEPSGAEVSINGVAHGHTPLTIENVAAGTRVVRLELLGYERWSWAVTVVANKRTPVRVKLQPEGRRLGASN